MTRYLLFFIPGILCLLTACKSTRSSSSARLFDNAIIAWNEDTLNSYYIALYPGKKFSYTTVTRNGSQKTEQHYKGSYRFSGDTIYLDYYKGYQPEDLTEHLIVEASNNYLIQYFLNNKKRMFLRIQRSGHSI